MTLPFWIRKTEVEIESIGRFRNGTFEGKLYDLDIFFELKNNKDNESTDKVEIYNIADQTRTQLASLLNDRKSNKQDLPLIFVRSGYESNFGLVREGRIEKMKNEHEQTGDVKTTISITNGKAALKSLIMEATYARGTPVDKFFSDIATITGYGIGKIDSSYTFEDPNGFIVDKSRTIQQWIDFVSNRTREMGEQCNFFFENGNMFFLKQRVFVATPAGMRITSPQGFHSEMGLDTNHGLLEAVECMDQEDDESGLELTCYLIPGITNGLKVILTTKFPYPLTNAPFVVREYQYVSTNEEHQVKMKVYPCEE